MIKVAIAVAPTQQGVWVVKRANPENGLVWTFPSGKLAHGETPQQAALREFYEETAQKMILAGLYRTVPGDGITKHYVLCSLECGVQGELTDPKIEEAKIVALDEMKRLFTTPVQPDILSYLERYYGNSGSPP